MISISPFNSKYCEYLHHVLWWLLQGIRRERHNFHPPGFYCVVGGLRHRHVYGGPARHSAYDKWQIRFLYEGCSRSLKRKWFLWAKVMQENCLAELSGFEGCGGPCWRARIWGSRVKTWHVPSRREKRYQAGWGSVWKSELKLQKHRARRTRAHTSEQSGPFLPCSPFVSLYLPCLSSLPPPRTFFPPLFLVFRFCLTLFLSLHFLAFSSPPVQPLFPLHTLSCRMRRYHQGLHILTKNVISRCFDIEITCVKACTRFSRGKKTDDAVFL